MKKYRWKPPEWLKVAAFIAIILTLHSIAVRADYPEVKKAAEAKEEVKELPRAETLVSVEVEPIEEGDYITEIALSYGLDPDIVKAVIQVESGGDEKAIGDGGRSFGLMQIQKNCHLRRMDKLGVDDLLDGRQNIAVGCDLLAELLGKYGDYDSALTAYNRGYDDGSREYARKVKEEEEND